MRLIKKLAENSDKDFVKVELSSKFMEMRFNIFMRMISGKRFYGNDCDMMDAEEGRIQKISWLYFDGFMALRRDRRDLVRKLMHSCRDSLTSIVVGRAVEIR